MSFEQQGAQAQAGWYPDGNGGQRYWDGSAWTEHTAPGPNRAVVPVHNPTAGGSYAPYAGGYPQGLVVAPKNPALAAIATFFIVGLGQILNGQVGKGIAFFCAAVVSGILCFVLIGFLLLPVVWIWAIADAYQGAQRWNLQHGIVS